jgi:hypothetical protein
MVLYLGEEGLKVAQPGPENTGNSRTRARVSFHTRGRSPEAALRSPRVAELGNHRAEAEPEEENKNQAGDAQRQLSFFP